MADQRLRGQGVTLIMTSAAGEESVIEEAAKSMEMTVKLELLEESYLGEDSARYDETFNGISGRVELHMQTRAWFQFAQRVKSRAQRRTAGQPRFDFMGVFAFDNGQRVRAIVQNCFFGEMPVNVGGKDEYITATINFAATDWRILGAPA